MTKTEQAFKRARELLDSAGLKEWKLGTFFSYHKLATTKHFTKMLLYNERFIQRCTEEEFDQVTIHEIAHMLAGPGKGHGRKFLDICRSLTDYPVDTHEFEIDIHRYDITCEKCGVTGSTNDNRARYCGTCLIPFKRKKFILPTVEWASTP